MEFQGTKGEWKYSIKHRGSTKDALINVELPDGVVLNVGRITDDDCTHSECCCVKEHANAKLIAAAPDLLKACQKVLKGGYGCAPSIEYMDSLKREVELAINKALQK